MKISQIYANKKFKSTKFNPGFNIILGKVNRPDYKKADSHNLGKTTLIEVIDFLLLKEIPKDHFLRKNIIFRDFIFFLEIELNNGSYLTIKRGINNINKIFIKIHNKKYMNYVDLDEEDWDIYLAISKAKTSLNKLLGFNVLTKWAYRKTVSYFLRTQNDYRDVFQLYKFTFGKHIDWKPFLFDLLGFDGDVVKEKYELGEKIKELELEIKRIKSENQANIEDLDKISGAIVIKEQEIDEIKKHIDNFNFYKYERSINKELIEGIEKDIAYYNSQEYSLKYQLEKIKESLNNKIKFNLSEVKEIFKEVDIYFSNQLVKDYEELIEFNKKVTKEREKYLREREAEIKTELLKILENLKALNLKRENMLSFLKDRESFNKFKKYQKSLAENQADIIRLESQLENIKIIKKLLRDLNIKKDKLETLIDNINIQIEKSSEFYNNIRKTFDQIVMQIIRKHAILSIKSNTEGNLEFSADIAKKEDEIEITAEGLGNTYRKFLCAAFDLAILVSYSNKSFFRFVYHDGILEGLDNRRKRDIVELYKQLCEKFGIQLIITAIEHDLPEEIDSPSGLINKSDIVLKLSDEGPDGKLFMFEY